MIDAYEFVVVSGSVNTVEDCAKLSEELDDYGSEGYRLVSTSTTTFGNAPHQTVWATMTLEKEAEEDGDPANASPDYFRRQLREIRGGAS